MESCCNNGGDGDITKLKLPIGFRFLPTEEELLLHYLKRKIFSMPLPAAVIPVLDVFAFNPSDLPGDAKEKRYFFCKRSQRMSSGNNVGGYWKVTAKNKQVTSRAAPAPAVIGLKRSLAYYKGKDERTRWMMREFCLVAGRRHSSSTKKPMATETHVGEWVVCYVYQRKSISSNRARERRCLVEASHKDSSPCSSVTTTEISISSFH